MTDEKTDQPIEASKISKLFDIRLVVGGLLTVYGVILLITGLVDSGNDRQKDAGLHLNVWTGVGMLVVGLAMLAWMRLRPLAPVEPDQLEDDGPHESRA